jgi:uncharacterized membrane protein YdfJ with MMPL/SSD domain
MVPAAVELLGDRVWWPSSPSGGSLVREAPVEEEPPRQPATVA